MLESSVRNKWVLAAAFALGACGGVSETHVDARPPADSSDVCVPESDQEFCARQASDACEQHAGLDNCGEQRQADCGACTAGMGCVAGACKTPVCTTFAYATPTTLSAFSRDSIEDFLAAVTPDGQTVVYLQTQSPSTCGNFHLIVADEVAVGSGTYTPHDVTTALQNLQLYLSRDGHTITADGLTLIAPSSDRKRLLATTRSARQATDFGTPSDVELAAINAQIAGTAATFYAPVLSADGLELVYKIDSTDTAQSGIYIATRATTSVPFAAGTKQASPVADYPYATGLSSDRLALFVFDNFTARVLTRDSTSKPFSNPNAPGAPPQVTGGWQFKPLADCSKLIAIASAGGGCAGEDIVLATRQ